MCNLFFFGLLVICVSLVCSVGDGSVLRYGRFLSVCFYLLVGMVWNSLSVVLVLMSGMRLSVLICWCIVCVNLVCGLLNVWLCMRILCLMCCSVGYMVFSVGVLSVDRLIGLLMVFVWGVGLVSCVMSSVMRV